MRSPTFIKHVLAATVFAAAAHAQTTINWFSIDAAGGQVSGGPFKSAARSVVRTEPDRTYAPSATC